MVVRKDITHQPIYYAARLSALRSPGFPRDHEVFNVPQTASSDSGISVSQEMFAFIRNLSGTKVTEECRRPRYGVWVNRISNSRLIRREPF